MELLIYSIISNHKMVLNLLHIRCFKLKLNEKKKKYSGLENYDVVKVSYFLIQKKESKRPINESMHHFQLELICFTITIYVIVITWILAPELQKCH